MKDIWRWVKFIKNPSLSQKNVRGDVLFGFVFRMGSKHFVKKHTLWNTVPKERLRMFASPGFAFGRPLARSSRLVGHIWFTIALKLASKENQSVARHTSLCGTPIPDLHGALWATSSQPHSAFETGSFAASIAEPGTTFTDEEVGGTMQPPIGAASGIEGCSLDISSPQIIEEGANISSVDSIRLTGEQEQVLSLVLDGASLFVGGKAGTGKSFLLREIVRVMRRKGVRVAVTASTGIASLNIGGNTFHSVFGVPVYQDDNPNWDSRNQCTRTQRGGHEGKLTYDVEVLSQLDVILIDEISLLHGGYLEALEHAARRAENKNCRKPFGGIQVILSGDFMQLMPFRFQQRGRMGCASSSASTRKSRYRLECLSITKECDVAAQHAAIKKVVEGAHKGLVRKVVRRRHRETYYNILPMYESYAFHNFLLHVQLSEPVRHRADMNFLQDLNFLRLGILTHRLSRSFILNREHDSAIRLFATRRAVKAYNERQLLSLNGRQMIFKTQVLLTGAGEDISVNRFGGAGGLPCSHTRRQFWSDVSLLHFTTCASFFARRHTGGRNSSAGPSARDMACNLSYAEIKSIIHELCQASSLDSRRFFAYVLPFSPLYSSTIRLVAVRSCGDSRKEAVLQLNLFLSDASKRMEQGAFSGGSMAAVRGLELSQGRRGKRRAYQGTGDGGFMFSGAPRWVLIRSESCSARVLAARLHPCFQRYFHDSIQNDLVLQTKRLKVGCRVMLLRNLNFQYVNGSLGTIVDFAPLSACNHLLPLGLKTPLPPSHLIFSFPSDRGECDDGAAFQGFSGGTRKKAAPCQKAGDTVAQNPAKQREPMPSSATTCAGHVELPLVRMDADGSIVAIPWISLPFPRTLPEVFFTARVVCMPLTPAYAFTVHKVQGITFDHPVLFDADGMFPCDHLVYVAASRVRRFSQFRSINVSPRMVTVHTPSLIFSEHLPDVGAATAAWNAWVEARGHSVNGDMERGGLFSPNWKDPI